MADDDTENISPSSSHPFFVRGGFPFVFLPTTGFTFANDHAHVASTDDQPTTETIKKKESYENSEEEEVEVKEEEGTESIDDDEVDHNDKKNDYRISQPKYSQLLKELDFSQTRMVDVTNLLSDELDQQGNSSNSDENEDQKKQSADEKYQSLSTSSDEGIDHQTKENNNFTNAVNDIENDLNNLAAIIQQASPIPSDKKLNTDQQKKHTFDEDDDTSRQATQNYDLLDNEQEDIIPSSKSSKIPRLIKQRSNENKPSVTQTNTKTQNQTKKQDEEIFTWENLINETNQTTQPPIELIFAEPIVETHSTPKKQQQQPVSSISEEKSKSKIDHRSRQMSSSTSSSDTDSVVEHKLYQSTQQQQQSPLRIPPQTLRQDSQGTLLDENLDDLSSQLKQVLFDQERQTLTTSTKDERTTDGMGSMTFPLSTPDILDNDISNQPNENLFRHSSNQQTDYNQHFGRHPSSNIPERSSQHRKKSHHHRHSGARHVEREGGINQRKTDDNWLTMLEKLEREHKTRLEKQKQQYEDYMHTLEDKIQRRFDDYLTLTNGFQESRLGNYDDTTHIHRKHPSIPIDSNIGRYKSHSHNHPYRPLAEDLISHYYPADSTLNFITSEKRRPTVADKMPRSRSREDIIDFQTELSAKHAEQIADLKLYYEHEINEIKSQLNRSKMGQTSSSTRQSLETIERINNENIRLHDEVNELRHSVKLTEDENSLLKRQLGELREQLNNKDLDLKNYHRTITDLERQLTEAENTKERQDEKFRHADRQALLYREENDKLKTDLNLTRERLLRLEERYHEQENENEILRRQLFMVENENNRIQNRMTGDLKLNSTMALNIPTSREYGRFTVGTPRQSSTTTRTSRDVHIDSARYQSNGTNDLFRHAHSPRPITRISDYLNEKPVFPQPYVPPSRPVYSPRKSPSNRRRIDQMTVRSSTDRQSKQSDQLEQKFDQLLKKKHDLEARINRIPTRGLTSTDRQLYDVLEREIERVEQQISSVKLELRKLNVLRTPH